LIHSVQYRTSAHKAGDLKLEGLGLSFIQIAFMLCSWLVDYNL